MRETEVIQVPDSFVNMVWLTFLNLLAPHACVCYFAISLMEVRVIAFIVWYKS